MRQLLAVLTCALCLSGIGATFWWYDWRTSLPTPKPAGVFEPVRGAPLAVPARIAELATPGAPLLIHFYNPHCPCSRFNQAQLAELHATWANRVRFVVVAENEDADFTPPLPGSVPLVLDGDGALAAALGVYSTPQAVLLDGDRKLIYLGNYNTSRYCADPKTEFVRLALESLEHDGAALPTLPAWGCELPATVAQRSR